MKVMNSRSDPLVSALLSLMLILSFPKCLSLFGTDELVTHVFIRA